MTWRITSIVPGAALLVSAGLLYAGVVKDLVRDWANDDNYSHGFLIVPIAAYLIWERREALRRAAIAPSAVGLVAVLLGLVLLVAGTLGAELFLTRVSMLWVLAGGILFVLGWRHLRIVLFPLLFLVLMIPIPAIIFNQIAFPLQLFASRVGAAGLGTLDIPVLREGNVIVLASITLEVAEACSGIRSLVSLLTLGVVLGYFLDSRAWVRTSIALATIPIAVVSNGLRVAGTGIAAHFYGNAAAEGFMHTFSGWLMFVIALVLLLGLQQVLVRLFPERPSEHTPLPADGASAVAGA
jgi:exosortase